MKSPLDSLDDLARFSSRCIQLNQALLRSTDESKSVHELVDQWLGSRRKLARALGVSQKIIHGAPVSEADRVRMSQWIQNARRDETGVLDKLRSSGGSDLNPQEILLMIYGHHSEDKLLRTILHDQTNF